MRKSDLLIVIDKKGDYSEVENAITGGRGLVPSNYFAAYDSIDAEPWFFGNIPRTKAEKLLLHPSRTHGMFLIRESEVIGSKLLFR